MATILIDTGSRMDEMIYEEFKATGNLDLVLARELANRGSFPAVDIQKSMTRHQELLFTDEEMQSVWQLRRALGRDGHGGRDRNDDPGAAPHEDQSGIPGDGEPIVQAQVAGGPGRIPREWVPIAYQPPRVRTPQRTGPGGNTHDL